jgi:hypothetical protein
VKVVEGMRHFVRAADFRAQGMGLAYRCWLAVAAWLLVGAFLAMPASARQAHIAAGSFGGEGSGPGQFISPTAVAVNSSTNAVADPSAGDVYVVDKGNNRVEQFDATGKTFFGEFEAPPGGFSTLEGIAVDSSEDPLDPSAGDVYVLDRGLGVIDKFTGSGILIGQLKEARPGVPFEEVAAITVDSSGRLWIYQSNKELDILNNAVANEYAGPEPSLESPFTPTAGSTLSVDGAGSIYVIRGNRLAAKLDASAAAEIEDISLTPQHPQGEREVGAIAADPTDNLLYATTFSGVHTYKTTTTTTEDVDSFGPGASERLEETGIAVNSSNQLVYVTDPVGNEVHVFEFVTLPDVTIGEAANLVVEGHATLNGVVNPQGTSVTSCEFEYGPQTSYGFTAPCNVLPSGASPVHVSAEVAGLNPGTTYHFRLVVATASGSTASNDNTFNALAAPTIEDESVSEVASDSATLSTKISPGAADTTYRFEYGPTTSYGSRIPQAGGFHTGASIQSVTGGAVVQDLQPETRYHYRVVAENLVTDNLHKQVVGEDRTFITRSIEQVQRLPDTRAWELVSPLSKDGATIQALTAEGGAIQAAEDGSRVAYVANAPVGSEPKGNPSLALTETLSTRQAGVWRSEDIATEHNSATGIEAGSPSEYRMFSPDLSLGMVLSTGVDSTPLAPNVTEKTIYVRDNATGVYHPLVTAENVVAGTHFGGHLEFDGATSDFSHAIIDSSVPLTSDPIRGIASLYDVTGGQVHLVSRLPGPSKGPAESPSLGFINGDVRNAISQDGSRVFWGAETHLYMRDTNSEETTQLDADQGGSPSGFSRPAKFQMASADGSKVFFEDAEVLTENSTANPNVSPPAPDLYVYDVSTHKLTDLTIDLHLGESANVQGAMLGASEDGDQVYLVANGVLSESKNAQSEEAVPGAMNLYTVRFNGSTWEAPEFIATLAETDNPDWGFQQEDSGNLGLMTARVSPNGRYLAFMSSRRLTGYDNLDSQSGQPDEEVFLYDAEAGKLTCASCNPTGARPHGVFDSGVFPGLLVDRRELWARKWIAANIPAWTSVDIVHATYQSRYLSDDGRLFFMSADSLVKGDINGTEDVYEYEPANQKHCTAPSGCVALLSSGESSQESAFLDASSSGDDAFFVTAGRLSSRDTDESFDVYDAHVCSGESPCSSSSSVPASPCESPESCRTELSQPFGSGSSATSIVTASGNLAASVAARKVVLTRAQKLAKALKQCRKVKRKRRRAACESRARKKYGSHKNGSHKKTTAGKKRFRQETRGGKS